MAPQVKIKELIVIALLVFVGSCSAQEKLDPPIAVSIGETTLTVKVAPKGLYGTYEIKLYNSTGDLTQISTTNLSYTFVGLNSGASYTVAAAVKTLEDGTEVNGTASDPLSITTKSIERLNVVRSDLNYTTEMADHRSTAFINASNTIRNDLKATYSFITRVEVLFLYSSSVGALVEVEKNSTNMVNTSSASSNTTISALSVTTALTMMLNPITDITSSGFKLNWTSTSTGSTPDQHALYVDCDGNSSIYLTNGSDSTYTVTGLDPGTTCEICVRGIVSSPTPAMSECSESRIVTTSSSGVPNLELIALSYQTIRVKFGYVVSGESYTISINDTNSTTATVSGTEISNGTFTKDITLEDIGGTFLVSVAATVNGETGESSNGTVTLVGTVSGLFVYNITEDGFNVFFEPVSLQGGTPIDSYRIKYVNSGTDEDVTTQDNPVHISFPPTNETFEVTVAYTASGVTSVDTEPVTTDVFTIGERTSTSIDFSWTAVSGVTQYIVSRLPTNTDPLIETTNTETFTNLSPGTTYQLSVLYFSTALGVQVTYFRESAVTAPGKVEGLGFSPLNISCFNVTWNPAAGASGYNVTVHPSSSDYEITINTDTSSAEVCNVATGDLYNVTVAATNEAGNGESEIVTDCHSALPAPNNISIKFTSPNCFEVSWVSLTTTAVSYTAKLTTSSETDKEETVSDSPVEFCNLTSATVYNATVSATYNAATSDYSTDYQTLISAPIAPTLTLANTSESTISLNWVASPSAEAYYVNTTDTTDTEVSVKKTDATAITISGLQAGTVYKFQAFAENAGGNSTPSTVYQQITAPNAVTDLSADTENVQLNVVFNWNATFGADKYDILVTVLDTGAEVYKTETNVTTWSEVTGLVDGETYQLDVTAITAAFTEIQQSQAATVRFQTAPPTPDNIIFTDITNSSFAISWDASTSATSYEIQITGDELNKTELPTNPSYTFSNLSAGTVYTVVIRARNEDGWSSKSDLQKQITEPNAVQNLRVAMPVPQRRFTVSWDSVVGAEIYIITATGEDSIPESQNSATTSSQFTDRAEGSTYTVSVVANTSTSDVGIQQCSPASTLTFMTAPSNPGTPTFDSNTVNSILFNWAASDGATSYNISVSDGSSNDTLTVPNGTLQNLSSGTCYTIEIIGINDYGFSQVVSGELCTKTDPPDFNIFNVTPTSMSLSWNAVVGGGGYVVEVALVADGSAVSIESGPFTRETTKELTKLSPRTNYIITMYTTGGTASDDSERISKNQLTAPATPDNLMCSASTISCFTFDWDAVSTAVNYTAQIDDTNNGSVTVEINNTIPDAQVCGVTTGSFYTMTVYATNSAGNGESNTVIECSSVLPVPSNVNIAVDNQTCFTIAWDEPATTVSSYTIKLASDTAMDLESTSNTTSVQVCNLEVASNYIAVVSGTYEAGQSNESAPTSQITAPLTPTLSCDSATTTSITLSWAASPTSTAYYVDATTPGSPGFSLSTSDLSLTISDLQPGTLYSFVGYAENAGGNSTASKILEQITVPSAVENFAAVTQDVQNNVTFSWSAVVGAETYGLTVVNSGGIVDSTNQTGTSWTEVKGLMAGETYDTTIIAYSTATTKSLASSPMTISFTTAPPTPKGLSIESITTTSFDVTYDSSSSATLYEVKIVNRLTDGSDGVFLDTMNSTTTTQSFTSLSPGTVYAVTVRAQNSGGWSLYSDEVLQITVPEKVTNLAFDMPVEQMSFRLTWDEVFGASTYELTVNDGAAIANVIPGHRVTSLTPGTNYTCSVVAKTSETNVGAPQISAAVLITVTTAPENTSIPTAITRDATSLEFGWKESTGATLYMVEVVDKNSGLSAGSENVTTNKTTFTELTSGTLYTVKITAVNSFGSSAIISGEFWTLPLPPDFAASDVTENSMVISWPEISNTIAYSIAVKRTSDDQVVNIASNLIRNELRVAISGLQPGTNYTITMTTVGQDDNSAEKALIQITLPLAPTITLTTRTTDTLGYSWDSVTGADNYSIVYSAVGVTDTTSDVTTGSSFDIGSLQAGTSYSVTISSVNDAGSNAATAVQHSTVISEGPMFTVSNISSTGFNVSITDVTDRASFDILVSPGGFSFNIATTTGLVTGLASGVTYSVSVVVNYNTVGKSSGSAAQTVTTLNAAVENFMVLSNTQDGGIELSWSEISTASSYVINVIPSIGSSTILTPTSSPLSVVTKLGLTYDFTIQAENSAGALSAKTELLNVAAAKPKEFTFEITLNSSFTFTQDLKNSSSANYTQLESFVVDLFTQIFSSVSGLLNISLGGAFQGSVIVRVIVDIDDPSTTAANLTTAFSETSVNKIAFNETAGGLTSNLNECLNEISVCHENATCTNTEESYTCSCKDGFEGNGTSCTDIDECSSSPCTENANCVNTIGSYTCPCVNGFEANGTACSDIDECEDNSTCSGNSTCSNNIGGFVCDCPAGYMFNNITCIDVDECNDSPCKSNSNCENVIGNYTCPCASGYTGDGKTSCADVDECVSDPCNPNSQCDNSEGSYSCPCNSGYTGDGKTSCVDVNECLNSPCSSNSQCKNNDGSYTCPCVTGYTGDGRTSCSDIDECNITPSSCTVNQTCDNTIGSFSCPCKSGYAENSDKTDCLDVDECATTNSCHENASCTNTNGSYLCSCKAGYTGNGTACYDVDECKNTGTCGTNEKCSNTIGSYNCACSDGYSRNSTPACVDVDECKDTGLCGDNYDCTNTVGSFSCACSQGYIRSGELCVDDNECNNGTDNCTDRAVCENTIGSFKCNCKTGYTGSNNVCDDVDECSFNSQLCNSTGQCFNVIGSYLCECTGGYALTGDKCENIDECMEQTHNCPTDRACRDTNGSYECICQAGYTGVSCLNGTNCENCADVNECNQANDCNTNAFCTNTDGSYSCACEEYYAGDGKTCTANMTRLFISQIITIYEYTDLLSRTTTSKSNLIAEVQKQVELQFPDFSFVSVTFSSGSGTSIIAVYVIETAKPVTTPVNINLYYKPNVGDTALFSNDPALAESCLSLTCSNGYCYSYMTSEACACYVGYDLSNDQCNDIDECENGQDTCHANATCSNVPGSYNCNCKSGYTRNGFNCSDFDECTAGTFTCRDNSSCQNSVGSYTCPCQPGFIESASGACIGQCAEISFCNNGGTCVPSLTTDTPSCQCPSAYTGDRCQDSSLYRNLSIAFGVIGGVLLVALIVAIIVYAVKRKRGGRDFIP